MYTNQDHFIEHITVTDHLLYIVCMNNNLKNIELDIACYPLLISYPPVHEPCHIGVWY